MAGGTFDSLGANLIRMHQAEFVEYINPAQIVPYLSGILSIAEMKHITNLEVSNREQAVRELIEILESCREKNWFEQFKVALEKAGYQILLKRMNLVDVKDKARFMELIRRYFPNIVSTIDPIEVTFQLVAQEALSSSDGQLILAECNNRGAQRGAMQLLFLLPYKIESWFSSFIKVLLKCKYDDLVTTINAGFAQAQSDDSIDALCSNIRRSGSSIPDPAMPCYETPRQSVTDQEAEYTTVVEEVMQVQGSMQHYHSVCAIPDQRHNDYVGSVTVESLRGRERAPPLTSTAVVQPQPRLPPEGSESQLAGRETRPAVISSAGSHIDDMETDGPLSNSVPSTDTGSASNNTSMKQNPILDRVNPRISSASSSTTCGVMSDSISTIASLSLNFIEVPSVTSDQVRGWGGNEARGSTDPRSNERRLSNSASNRNESSSDVRMDDSSAIQDHDSNKSSTIPAELVKQALELREYQKELIEDAMSGKNCLICAPTGTGKTCVAIAISQHHLDEATNGADEPKIAFIVPTVALVDQQLTAFRKFLQGDWNCQGLSGETEESKLPLNEILLRNDILVMTPQILLNALEMKDIDSLGVFSLMILDECHHTAKDHPYNRVMGEFYVEKLLNAADESVQPNLPKVIGLTASPGVGKACRMEEAINHILSLCANLAASCLSIVRRNVEELERYTNRPEDRTCLVYPRQNDAFQSEVIKVMKVIEEYMLLQDLTEVLQDVPNIENVLRPTQVRGSEPYRQYLAKIKEEVAPVDDRKFKKIILSCQRHLEIYNLALIINEDCRTVDGMNYLVENMEHVPHASNEDRYLKGIYSKNKVLLKSICESKQQDNPKLAKLKELILRRYYDNNTSQGIVFCKTRETTTALLNWVKGDPDMKRLNPGILKGTQKSGADSFTRSKLEDNIDQFRKGNHKLMFATTVAEEGLDIGNCNYVIRYEYATNSIGRTQAGGRARKDQAEYILLSDPSRGNIAQDEANKIRESMLTRALSQVHDMAPDDFQTKVLEFQEQAKQERARAKLEAEVKNQQREERKNDNDYELICFKCNKHATLSSYLRTIQGTHHVVLGEKFQTRVIRELHPTPKKISCGMEKKHKLLCKECRYDWGITATHKGVLYPVLKVCSFVIVDPNQKKSTVKKWKDISFPIKELPLKDMEIMGGQGPDNGKETSASTNDGSVAASACSSVNSNNGY